MPTSITVAPGLIQSLRTISGRPTAANTRSARRHTAGRSRGLRMRDRHGGVLGEQQAAPAACRRCWSGRSPPPRALRATDAPSSPGSCSRAACTAPAPAGPAASRPTLTGWKPSTSLAGSIASSTFCASICARQRQLHQDAVHHRIAVEAADQRQQVGLAHRRRQAMIERAHAAADGRLGLEPT